MNVENVNGLIEEIIGRAKPVDYTVKLPEAEFDVMSAIWEGAPPLTTSYLMQKIGHKKGWKAPTLISFLTRLEDRGFIHSEKKGKERYYYVDAVKNDYIKSVTVDFLDRYHDGSFVKMLDLLYGNGSLPNDELDKMLKWLQEQY